MTEDDAFAWCERHFGGAATARLDRFRVLLLDENQRQNLISPASTAAIWTRHLVDSAQLVDHCPPDAKTWFDVGSGPGLPGLVVAILLPEVAVSLIEPRGRRVDFLNAVSETMALSNVTVVKAKVETVTGCADVVSARAVASLPDLVAMTSHLRHQRTRMILPRGQKGDSDVAMLPAQLRSMFHVEQSVTDPASVIVIGDGVRS